MTRPPRPVIRSQRVRPAHLVLATLIAAFAFGGSFTCEGSTSSRTPKPTANAIAR